MLKKICYQSLNNKTEKAPPIDERFEIITEYFAEFKKASKESNSEKVQKLRERDGFFLTNLVWLLRYSALIGKYDPLPFAPAAIKLFKERNKLTDAIIVAKLLKPGITSDFELVAEGQNQSICKIGEFSRIVDEMRRSSLLFPPFYAYIYVSSDKNTMDFMKMREDFGGDLWQAFSEWVDYKYNKGEELQ
jgi:hypothetical protein